MVEVTATALSEIASLISAGMVTHKGTNAFYPHPLKDIFRDRTLSFMLDDEGDREFGRSMNDDSETAIHLDLSKRNWYAFNDCYGTSEEKLLVKYIDKRYPELKKRYSDVYLLRNEKHFKVYSFDDGRPLEPDFVLYLVGKEKRSTGYYQVFIEPKGAHLLRADEWKEVFLKSIKANFKVEKLFAGKSHVIWGLPFFNDALKENEFVECFNELLA